MKMINYFLLSASLLLLLQLSSHAQLSQGNVLVGGDIANLNLSLNKGGNFSMSVQPKVAWFIRPNIAVGPYGLFAIATAKGEGTSINYGIGSLGRYYFSRDEVNLLRHTRLFAEANVGIEGYNPATGDNTNGLGLGFGPGIAYFITPSIGLEFLAKYDAIIGFGSTPATNNISLNIGLQAYLPSGRIRERVEDTHR